MWKQWKKRRVWEHVEAEDMEEVEAVEVCVDYIIVAGAPLTHIWLNVLAGTVQLVTHHSWWCTSVACGVTCRLAVFVVVCATWHVHCDMFMACSLCSVPADIKNSRYSLHFIAKFEKFYIDYFMICCFLCQLWH